MRFFRGAFPALALALTLAPAFAQDPFQDLAQYDYQDRKPLDVIAKQITAAGLDRSKLAVIEDGLVKVLNNPAATLGAKQEACTFLCGMGSVRSVPTLAKLLQSPELANLARLALERNPDPMAGAILRAAMNSSRGAALVGAINSVGNRGDAQGLSKLKALASNPDGQVSEAAIIGLGKIGTPAAVAALKSLKVPTRTVSSALLKAADKLATSGKRPDALSLYESLTAAKQPEVIRAGALTGLAALGAPKTGEVALGMAKTASEPTLQRVAARVLGTLTTADTTQEALAAFGTLPATAQIALLLAWSDRKETAAASVTTKALASADSEVREAAILAASRVCGAAVVPALAELATNGESTRVAREALARMGGKGVEEALLALADQGNLAVIGVLGQRPTAASTARLVALSAGKDARVAVASLKVLERTAGLTQEAPLVSLLVGTENEPVRDAAQAAIVAIAQRSGQRDTAVQPLLAALPGASLTGQGALLSALAELGGDRALEELTRAATSDKEELRSAALAGLANAWSDARPLPTLLQIVKTSTVKSDQILALRGCLRVLGADERVPAEQKLASLTELFGLAERPEEKRQVLSVLREVRLPGALVLATKALDSTELVAEAADAILYLASPQRKDQRNLAAVKGSELVAALDRILATTTDEKLRAQALKLKGQ